LNPPDEDLSGLRHAHGVESQAGALAYLPEADPLRFVVVTSRRTGRWVFPKGGVDPGMTAPEAARREALEEAGVIGRVADRAIGVYRVPKIRPPLIWTVEVTLYPMAVEEVLDLWIEADQRRRRFVTLDQARTLLADPGMIRVLGTFSDAMGGDSPVRSGDGATTGWRHRSPEDGS